MPGLEHRFWFASEHTLSHEELVRAVRFLVASDTRQPSSICSWLTQ